MDQTYPEGTFEPIPDYAYKLTARGHQLAWEYDKAQMQLNFAYRHGLASQAHLTAKQAEVNQKLARWEQHLDRHIATVKQRNPSPDPRKVGGIYWCAYWAHWYVVLDISRDLYGHMRWITVYAPDVDQAPRTHCTAWYPRDQVLWEPA